MDETKKEIKTEIQSLDNLFDFKDTLFQVVERLEQGK